MAECLLGSIMTLGLGSVRINHHGSAAVQSARFVYDHTLAAIH
jgi:hypothetical protein